MSLYVRACMHGSCTHEPAARPGAPTRVQILWLNHGVPIMESPKKLLGFVGRGVRMFAENSGMIGYAYRRSFARRVSSACIFCCRRVPTRVHALTGSIRCGPGGRGMSQLHEAVGRIFCLVLLGSEEAPCWSQVHRWVRPARLQALNDAQIGDKDIDDMLNDMGALGEVQAYVADPPLVCPNPHHNVSQIDLQPQKKSGLVLQCGARRGVHGGP